MNFIRLFPVVSSLLLLGAHFLRSGAFVAVAACVALSLLLFVRRPWVARTVQGVLVLAAAEWIRTVWVVAADRRGQGLPWFRMAVILGSVALFTLLSTQVFRLRDLRERYGLNGNLTARKPSSLTRGVQ